MSVAPASALADPTAIDLELVARSDRLSAYLHRSFIVQAIIAFIGLSYAADNPSALNVADALNVPPETLQLAVPVAAFFAVGHAGYALITYLRRRTAVILRANLKSDPSGWYADHYMGFAVSAILGHEPSFQLVGKVATSATFLVVAGLGLISGGCLGVGSYFAGVGIYSVWINDSVWAKQGASILGAIFVIFVGSFLFYFFKALQKAAQDRQDDRHHEGTWKSKVGWQWAYGCLVAGLVLAHFSSAVLLADSGYRADTRKSDANAGVVRE